MLRQRLQVLVILVVLAYVGSLCIRPDHRLVATTSGTVLDDGAKITGMNKVLVLDKPGVHVFGVNCFTGPMTKYVGLIEDFNRIEKLREIEHALDSFSNICRLVGLVTNGGTHKKPALSRIRDDVALDLIGDEKNKIPGFSPSKFFKSYDMGKFLSVDHGCTRPYILVYDVVKKAKVVEKIGPLASTLNVDFSLPNL